MTQDQAQQIIEQALEQIAPDVDAASLTLDTDLRDGIGLDSMDFLRFVEILTEQTGRQIGEDDYPQLATLGSAIKFLAGR